MAKQKSDSYNHSKTIFHIVIYSIIYMTIFN